MTQRLAGCQPFTHLTLSAWQMEMNTHHGEVYFIRRTHCPTLSSRITIEVKTSRPSSVPGKPIYLRLENQVALNLTIRGCGANNLLPWDCLQIPLTKSVKKPGIIGLRTPIQFSLEVRGATTGKLYQNPCKKCAIRDPRSATSPLVDFVARENFIDLKGGHARIAFRFLCYSHHQNSIDTEYRCALSSFKNASHDAIGSMPSFIMECK